MSIVAVAGSAFTFYIPGLEDQANPGLFKSAPTIAAGDFTMSINGGALDSLDNTPTVSPAGSTQIKIILSATETTAAADGGKIAVFCQDAAGAEWYSVAVVIDVKAADLSDVNVIKWHGVAPLALSGNSLVQALIGEGVHGSTSATLTLGRLTLSASTMGGKALVIQATNPAGGKAIEINGGWKAIEVTGDVEGLPGLSAQEVRDAMMLAPTAGAPAAGSIDDHLDDMPADVWSYVTRTLTQSSTSTTDSTAAGSISRRRGDSWSISLTVGALTGYTSLWFTVKADRDVADSAAIFQIKLNSPSASDGLLYVNGTDATDGTKGSITVSNASTGAIVIALDESITDDLPTGAWYYDVQALISGAVSTPDSGTFTVTADVTRSIT